MEVKVYYFQEDMPITLKSVSSIKKTGWNEVEITCFGNEPVKHRNVQHVQVAWLGF